MNPEHHAAYVIDYMGEDGYRLKIEGVVSGTFKTIYEIVAEIVRNENQTLVEYKGVEQEYSTDDRFNPKGV